MFNPIIFTNPSLNIMGYFDFNEYFIRVKNLVKVGLIVSTALWDHFG